MPSGSRITAAARLPTLAASHPSTVPPAAPRLTTRVSGRHRLTTPMRYAHFAVSSHASTAARDARGRPTAPFAQRIVVTNDQVRQFTEEVMRRPLLACSALFSPHSASVEAVCELPGIEQACGSVRV